jgi:hypothetical protein
MNKIILLPQVGVSIEGAGQVNFGSTREKLISVFGAYQSINREDDKRVEYTNYGFFADFKKSDDTFEAVEFWNDGKENGSEVFIYDTEVLQGNAQEIKVMLQQKNKGEAPNDGWFVNIDVIYSGGSIKSVLEIIEQYKSEGTYEESKGYLMQDLENAKHFTTFGIGYKGYCKNGLAELKALGL